MDYNTSNLIIHPQPNINDATLITRVTPQLAGWEYLSMESRRLPLNAEWQSETGSSEMAIVIQGGLCSVKSSRGSWESIGRRKNVFDGLPYAVYLPPHTTFTLIAQSESVEIAAGWCPAEEDHAARLITPADCPFEIRGGGNATRQIVSILPPGAPCQRLVVVEVYTPSGNWSSYPPHKHDVHRTADNGSLLEADLEEIYYYKIDKPTGYAVQRVYTSDHRIDALLMAQSDDAVLVPEGYHPVTSAPGYTTYYLNFLAGSAQSLANMDDPDHAWVKETWTEKDPRVPVVNLDKEQLT